jgi:hypothetical protein
MVVAGVLATVFVASKIAAGVQATIVLINLLIGAYAALRNSAVAAAIASRFALNPLAGLATGAAVVGAIIAATKLFDNQANAAASTGSNTVSSSSLPSGFTVGTPIIGGGAGASTGGSIGGGKIIAPIVTGTMPNFPSGLNSTGKAIPSGFDVAAARRGEERGNVIINVNAPSAIDEEGFTRAVVLALNNSNARNGGGGAILGGLVAQ